MTAPALQAPDDNDPGRKRDREALEEGCGDFSRMTRSIISRQAPQRRTITSSGKD